MPHTIGEERSMNSRSFLKKRKKLLEFQVVLGVLDRPLAGPILGFALECLHHRFVKNTPLQICAAKVPLSDMGLFAKHF